MIIHCGGKVKIFLCEINDVYYFYSNGDNEGQNKKRQIGHFENRRKNFYVLIAYNVSRGM